MMFTFTFKGNVHRFEQVVMRDTIYKTQAVSKEKAISNICSRAKKGLGFDVASKISLTGILHIDYNNEFQETYEVNCNELTPIEEIEYKYDTHVNKANKVRIPKHLKEKYRLEKASLEEIKYYAYIDEHEPQGCHRWMLGNQIIQPDNVSLGKYIEYNGDTYYYDEDEEVYWLDGNRFTTSITELS